MFTDKLTQAVAEAYKKMKQEELKGDQHKIDANKNGQIDAHDFKILRGQKNEETEPKSEKEKDLAALGHPKDKITHKDVLIGRGVIKKEEWDSKKPTVSEAEELNEDLRNWFKPDHPEGGWKRINSKGEAIGPCAREPGEPKPKCMSNEKRASLTKKERAAAVSAKRRHDPNPERKGAPINVSNFGKGKISESVEYIEEKNAPTNPELWSRAKALAKQKFDVYPSAYANGWASKWYKSKGGGWKTVSEELELQEGKMAQLHADIEDAVGQHVKDYNAGKLGHDSFGEKVVAAHQKISKLHGIKPEHAKKFVNDYVDQNMKEEVELDEMDNQIHHPGTKVKVPHRGKMVSGKVVRHDKGDKYGSPFYVVDVGEYESAKVPAHNVTKEEVRLNEVGYQSPTGDSASPSAGGRPKPISAFDTGSSPKLNPPGSKPDVVHLQNKMKAAEPENYSRAQKVLDRPLNTSDIERTPEGSAGSRATGRPLFSAVKTQNQIKANPLFKKEEVELTEGNDDVGEMIKDKLKIIINRAKEMHDGIGPNTDMPEWVKSKITLAQDYVSTACDYSCGNEQLGEGLLGNIVKGVAINALGRMAANALTKKDKKDKKVEEGMDDAAGGAPVAGNLVKSPKTNIVKPENTKDDSAGSSTNTNNKPVTYDDSGKWDSMKDSELKSLQKKYQSEAAEKSYPFEPKVPGQGLGGRIKSVITPGEKEIKNYAIMPGEKEVPNSTSGTGRIKSVITPGEKKIKNYTIMPGEKQVDERCWDGYKPVEGKGAYSKGSCTKEEVEIQEDMGEPDIKVRSTYTKAYADHYKRALRMTPKGASKRAQIMAYDTVKAKHGEEATNALRAFHDKNQNEGYQLDEELSSRAKLVKELFNKAKEKKSKKDVFEADPEMEIMPSPQYSQQKNK